MKKCEFCKIYSKIKSDEIDLEVLSEKLDPIFFGENKLGNEAINDLNNRFKLWKCTKCETYWEWRPLYEENMYGGEPGEWVKVTEEYVKKQYSGAIDK